MFTPGGPSRARPGRSSALEGRHATETAQVPLRLAELGAEERLHQIPRDRGAHRPPAHAEDVHVIVLHALTRGEVIVDQGGADALDLVGAHRGADPAPADRYAAVN